MVLRLPVALLSATALLLAGPGAAAAGPPSADPADRAAAGRVVKPGQIGKAVVGMTIAQAMATGELNQDVDNDPCEPVRLQPKGSWKRQYVVFADTEITGMMVTGSRPRTAAGLGAGSTVREVREVYGTRISPPRESGFEQWGLFVKRGSGADRRWLGFLFGEASTDRKLRGRDKVTHLGVSVGKRPDLYLDGC